MGKRVMEYKMIDNKVRTSFSLSKELAKRINDLPRNVLPNKSNLVEKLLSEWLDKIEQELNDEKN